MTHNISDPVSRITLDAIRAHHSALADEIIHTPSLHLQSPLLSRVSGAEIFLKLELFQKTGTFKARGALSVAREIPPEARARGVTAVSAGNHAIAAAWAAQMIGAPAKLVMISSANPYRVAQARNYGAELVMVEGAAAAFQAAERFEAEEGLTLIHPYEGVFTTLGAAGVGYEFAQDVEALDAVIIASGGGGLTSGVAAAMAQMNPHCAVYAVEPEGAASLKRSLEAGEPQRLEAVNTRADSLGAPGALPFSFALCQHYLSEVVTVSDAEILAGLALYQEEAKLAVEPAAGAALAALLGPLRQSLTGKRVGLITCGANIDAASYAALLDEGRQNIPALLG